MNLKRHHVLYIVITVSLILGLIFFFTPSISSLSYRSTSGQNSIASTTLESGETMDFEVVTTETAQEQGLSGRSLVPENYGMLFVFDHKFRVGFWMKDMLVPIDIIWLSDSGTILGVEDSISPDTYPKSVYPPEPVRYVLEVRAGEMRRKGWGIGTRIPLPLPYGT